VKSTPKRAKVSSKTAETYRHPESESPRLSESVRAFSRSIRRDRRNTGILMFSIGPLWQGSNLEVRLHFAKLDSRIKRALKSVQDAVDQRQIREYSVAKPGTAKVTASFVRRAGRR
jgi:hypothetical protein